VFDRVLALDGGVARRGQYGAGGLVAGGPAPEWSSSGWGPAVAGGLAPEWPYPDGGWSSSSSVASRDPRRPAHSRPSEGREAFLSL
jgi:hypothetical protein